MKIVPINNFNGNFKGYTRYLSRGSYGSYDVVDKPVSNQWYYCGDHDSRAEFAIKMSARPNSTIEKTLGNYHEKMYNNIYYADPLEYIDDEKRRSYDFIVYDNEPKYPHPDKISKSYFHDECIDYKKDFEEVRDYYYRLEMADRKALAGYENNKAGELSATELNEKIGYYKNRIEQSQYQQWQAQECLNKYSAAEDLLSKKIIVSRELDSMKSALSYNDLEQKHCNERIDEISKERNGRLEEQKLFAEKRTNYQNTIKANEALSKIYDGNYSFEKDAIKENKYAQKQIKWLDMVISNKQQDIDWANNELSKLKAQLEECIKRPQELPAKIKAKAMELADIKARLIPLFDDLKLFYAARKILG